MRCIFAPKADTARAAAFFGASLLRMPYRPTYSFRSGRRALMSAFRKGLTAAHPSTPRQAVADNLHGLRSTAEDFSAPFQFPVNPIVRLRSCRQGFSYGSCAHDRFCCWQGRTSAAFFAGCLPAKFRGRRGSLYIPPPNWYNKKALPQH